MTVEKSDVRCFHVQKMTRIVRPCQIFVKIVVVQSRLALCSGAQLPGPLTSQPFII